MREYRANNLERSRARDRAAYRRRSNEIRKLNLKRFYGLSDKALDAVEAASGCEICGRSGAGKRSRLVIDHCHGTNRNRGILCSSCNAALGQFRDDLTVLRRAVDYVARGGFGFFEETDQ